jgi:hypothetical protein
LRRLSSSRRSSASGQKTQSPAACLRDSLRASAKLSYQGKSKTLAPKEAATSLVRSVDPVSTTIISSTRSAVEARQSGRLASSSLTIMHNDTRRRTLGAAGRPGAACITAWVHGSSATRGWAARASRRRSLAKRACSSGRPRDPKASNRTRAVVESRGLASSARRKWGTASATQPACSNAAPKAARVEERSGRASAAS